MLLSDRLDKMIKVGSGERDASGVEVGLARSTEGAAIEKGQHAVWFERQPSVL
jgi:hypothetical protein